MRMDVDGEVIQLELKYCERCGGLWLRLRGSDHAYCATCTTQVTEQPVSRRKKPGPRLPINRAFDGSRPEAVEEGGAD